MKLSVGSYDNSTTVDNEAEILADFQQRSQQAYQSGENIMTFVMVKVHGNVLTGLFLPPVKWAR